MSDARSGKASGAGEPKLVSEGGGAAGEARRVFEGLPASWYYDPTQYALELNRIWYRNWVYVGRSARLAEPRTFLRFSLGDQELLLVRDEAGIVRGFHNTCRHRGAALCAEPAGKLSGGTLVCPYHAWIYGLDGQLLRTSSRALGPDFDRGAHSLYPIHVKDWNGFLFVTLAERPPSFESCFDQAIERMDAWDLADLTVGHVMTKVVRCNWKIFWENYNECLHCPGVHPQLSQLVPIFGRGLLEERDDPQWADHAHDTDPRYKGGLRRGAVTWSRDGRSSAVAFPRLSAADRAAGHVYMTGLPAVFIVGHVDYVRVVRLLPLAPEKTELRVEYLFSEQTLASPDFDLAGIVEFTNLVMSEDAEICEVNQQGLHALAHARGVVMPEEYLIRDLHLWISGQLGEARPNARSGSPP